MAKIGVMLEKEANYMYVQQNEDIPRLNPILYWVNCIQRIRKVTLDQMMVSLWAE